MTLIARVGAAIGSADADTQAVLRDALAALVEDYGLLATLERRKAADRKRKQPTDEHASTSLNSAESAESAPGVEFREGCSLPPEVSLLSPEPPNNSSLPPRSLQGDAQGAREYPPAFAAVWERYPRRAGGNSKREAYRAWSARLAQGVTVEELAAGVERYRAFIEATGKESTEYVMQTATFFGPNERWREVWLPPTTAARNGAKPTAAETMAASMSRIFTPIETLEPAR